MYTRKKIFINTAGMYAALCLFALCPPLWSQAPPGASLDSELFTLVGIRLDELIMRFGIPQTVYAARGEEHWQDDVVFVYNQGNFHIYHDRVWQIGFRSAYGMNVGDLKAVAMLIFGENAYDAGSYILYPLPPGNWPLSLRVNISNDRISGIFVFRPDF